MRKRDGGFVVLATDLKGTDWSYNSQYIHVWDPTDLAAGTWTAVDQRNHTHPVNAKHCTIAGITAAEYGHLVAAWPSATDTPVRSAAVRRRPWAGRVRCSRRRSVR